MKRREFLHRGEQKWPSSAPSSSEPRDEQVRVMWDYYAFPVWSGADLTPLLHGELQAWSDEGTERFSETLRGEELPVGWVDVWSDRGRELARRVAAITGEVEYHNEATGEVERIVRP
jgi:hypothetical protein